MHSLLRIRAASGAVTVTRSVAEPHAVNDSNWPLADRSFLWGSVDVRHFGGN